jgi:hypothetical protein
MAGGLSPWVCPWGCRTYGNCYSLLITEAGAADSE